MLHQHRYSIPFLIEAPDETMSKISPLDLGEPLSPLPPDLSVHFANTIDLAHKLAVRIACHVVRDRLPEAQAYLEVDTCINLNGAKTSEEHAIQICIDGELSTFQHQLKMQFGWELTLIMDWVSKPQEVQPTIIADEEF